MGTNATNTNSSYFYPDIWSREVLRIFDATSVMRNIVNTNWEGEIRAAGDSVKIQSFGNVSVGNYTEQTDISLTNLAGATTSLLIDQKKYFAFEVDDIEKAQSNVDFISGYTQRAGVAMANAIDALLLAEYANAHYTVGTDAVPIDLASTAIDVYDQIIDLNTVLDEHNIPSGSRYLVVPPRVAAVMKKNDLFVQANTSGDGGALLRSGQIGQIAGMTIVVSNNITSVDHDSSTTTPNIFPCLALTPDAITFAMQLTQVEAVRPPLRFTTIVKGLSLFGYKAVQPTAMVAWKVNAVTI